MSHADFQWCEAARHRNTMGGPYNDAMLAHVRPEHAQCAEDDIDTEFNQLISAHNRADDDEFFKFPPKASFKIPITFNLRGCGELPLAALED